ncbi:hypothetical protein [Candidatus Enterococcus clewellii]|uniref:Uncharacterized protein n=1 Tax=Candidatus Enterococcus clewellii TaxID=1834193 RepID=A0A242K2G1_9ENTE|nr:hypothetical protein [Enterococcus sp. 9E7_DIV0242]OTP11652.1 hypothetical protein A5888_003751 [Enterococcus sp. 9E7_DIV0242]
MGLELLDWLLIGLIAATVIFLALLLAYLVGFFFTSRKLSVVKKKRPKKKKNRRKWAGQIRKIEQKKKTYIKLILLFLFLSGLCGGGGYYTKYYQMTNLAEKDKEALVQGYFLMTTIEEQLNEATETDSPKRVQGTVYDLSARLASYGATTPDGRLSKDGYLLLKRLYQSMKELGLILTSVTEETIQKPEAIEEYMGDIQKVKAHQKKVFEHFRINESSLKQDM